METVEQMRLQVEGMDCANCAQTIQRYLSGKGLKNVQVDFQAKELIYTPDDQVMNLEQVMQGVSKLGYSIVKPQEKGPFLTLDRLLVFCAILTVPFMVQHLLHLVGAGWHVLDRVWLQLAMTFPVYLAGIWYFGRRAWSSLVALYPNMDVLILLGSLSAWIYSLAGFFLARADMIFFETGASIITLVLLGNWIEQRTGRSTTRAIDELKKLQAQVARRKMPSGAVVTLEVQEIQKGDLILVAEGEVIPLDGVIRSGVAWIDESLLTGESDWNRRESGEKVVGASVIRKGNVEIEVTRIGSETFLSRMIEMVKQANREKPSIVRLADKISAIFVPVVILLALLTFFLAYWGLGVGATESLFRAIAVLVISCPCAMGLATPTAVASGMGRLARMGILVRGADTLEKIPAIQKVFFDKTGTLTLPGLRVRQVGYLGISETEADRLAYAMEGRSGHPLAKSVLAYLDQKYEASGIAPLSLEVEEVAGSGLSSNYMGDSYFIGKADREFDGVDPDMVLLRNNEPVMWLVVSEELRKEIPETVKYLQGHQVDVEVLSGDRAEKVEEVCKQLGIGRYRPALSPEDKIRIVRDSSGQGLTLMVGDGINDAPALAMASVSVTFQEASHIAIQSSQVILLGSRFSKLKDLFQVSRHTLMTIRQNLFWAFSYNVVAIPLAALGFLNPMYAALFMAFSDLVVIGNSIRLQSKKLN